MITISKLINIPITSHSYHFFVQKDITSHLLEWPLLKRQEITSVGEGLEKRESLCTLGDYCIATIIMEKSMEVP